MTNDYRLTYLGLAPRRRTPRHSDASTGTPRIPHAPRGHPRAFGAPPGMTTRLAPCCLVYQFGTQQSLRHSSSRGSQFMRRTRTAAIGLVAVFAAASQGIAQQQQREPYPGFDAYV